MFGNLYTRSLTGGALMLAMAANMVGVGSASAHTLTPATTAVTRSSPADIHVKLTYSAETALAPGSAFVYNIEVTNDGNGSASNAWVEMGFDASDVVIDDFTSGSSDIFVQSLATDNINIKFNKLGPGDTASAQVMAHLVSTASATISLNNRATVTWDDASGKGRSTVSNVLYMSAGQMPSAPTAQIDVVGSAAVDAGTVLMFQGTSFASDERVAFWLNTPAGLTIAEKSLGQTDTYVQGTVISLDRPGFTDDNGAIGYTLDTSGLASGTYTLVGQGWGSGLTGTVTFIIN
jgi:hypothetical protein